MEWLYYLLLIITLFAGLWFNIIGLPGLWLMVIAHAIYGWLTGWNFHIGWASLLWITGLAVLAEIIEFIAGSAGAKTAGGSKRGMLGAIVGGIVGGIVGTGILPIPIVGTVVGAIAGSFAGALGVELLVGKSMDESMRIGVGAAKGRFWGIVSKSALGIVMLIISAITALPIGVAAAPVAPVQPLPATQPRA